MTKRLGMVIDLDRCTGCGSCQVACRLENNIAPGGTGDRASDWLKLRRADNGKAYPRSDLAYVPVLCNHCEHPPCVQACPVGATRKSARSGIVSQVYARCIGCRACMAACPYGARVFNWTDPSWPGGLARALTPYASVRGRGVVEKCSFCSHRREGQAGTFPACAQACPGRAIICGDLDNPEHEVSRLAASPEAFRLAPVQRKGAAVVVKEPLPQVFYLSRRAWLREWADRGGR